MIFDSLSNMENPKVSDQLFNEIIFFTIELLNGGNNDI
jgi:hypothetical protein